MSSEMGTADRAPEPGLHVIFGTGPVGCSAAKLLLEKGFRVRMVNRTGGRPDGLLEDLTQDEESRLEIRPADALDAASVLAVSEGATHIYHCANVSYELWYTVLPRVHANLVEAAITRGAVLAAAENLYMYARGVPRIDEAAPEIPPSRKGRLQHDLHGRLIDAGQRRGLKWVSVRASDFYGPGAILQSVFGTTRFLDPLFAGRRPGLLGDPDQPHTYTYVGDYGRALAHAALTPEAHGRAWIVPNDRTMTSREVARLFFAAAARGTGVSRIPRFVLAGAGLFSPVIRELGEVLYQKEEPYIVDGSLFSSRFGFTPTPLEEGIRRTLEWYTASRHPLPSRSSESRAGGIQGGPAGGREVS
jgi:nucleoside-diphosphate-sugar epimerase